MNGRDDARRGLRALSDDLDDPTRFSVADVQRVEGVTELLDEVTLAMTTPSLVMIVAVSPSAASAADGDDLGTVIAAWGDPDELLEAKGEPHALMSDSTRRAGVVADVDPAATVAGWLDLPYEAGAPMRPTDEPAPLDLYERYLQQRRLAVPVAAGAWGLMLLFGLAGCLAIAFRERVSSRTLAIAGALAGSLPWLAVGLLLVGHLPSLTYLSVGPFLLAMMGAGVAFTRWSPRAEASSSRWRPAAPSSSSSSGSRRRWAGPRP